MNKIIYKVEEDNLEILNNLEIKEFFPIEDNFNNKLIVNKLSLNNSKLFFETNYLKVLKIDGNKLYLELPEDHIKLFNYLDDKCSELLEYLVNEESEINIVNLIECLEFNNFTIQYKPLLDDNSNVLKINIFSNTTIKLGNQQSLISSINPNDYIRLVIGLDYISLLLDTDLIARTKLYSYYVDIHKLYSYNPEPRDLINHWNFSSKLKSENIFVKNQTTENDNFDVNTEIHETKLEMSNNYINNLKLIIEEKEDDEDNNLNDNLIDIKSIIIDKVDKIEDDNKLIDETIINLNENKNEIDEDNLINKKTLTKKTPTKKTPTKKTPTKKTPTKKLEITKKSKMSGKNKNVEIEMEVQQDNKNKVNKKIEIDTNEEIVNTIIEDNKKNKSAKRERKKTN